LLYFGFFEIHKVLSSTKNGETFTNANHRALLKKDNKITSNNFSKNLEKSRVITLDKMLTDQGLFPAMKNDFSGKFSKRGLNLQVDVFAITTFLLFFLANYKC